MVSGATSVPPEASRQRRYVAVFYADLCDSSTHAANLEAELYAELLAELRSLCREIIPRHGGTLLQVHGDGQLSMFGFPHAGEEDVRLAVNAALDLHAAVRALQFDLPELARLDLRLHSGVHAGLVIVQEGDVYGGSYQLSGEVTNLCQRLSAAAGRDEILVCAESLRGSEAYFDCGPLRTLDLRGFSAAVQAYPVAAAIPVTSRYQARRNRSNLSFVGRDLELALLQQRWEAVQTGVSVTVYLVGSPGVGKSRLVEHFLQRPEMSDARVLSGYCEDGHNARPLGAFHSLLRAHPELLEVELGTGAGEFDIDDHQALSRLLISRVEAYVRGAPLVLFLDDWQWADEASRRLIGQLIPRIELPLMILLARRDMDDQESSMLSSAEIIPLDGLNNNEANEAIQMLSPRVDPFVRAKIHGLAGGNPLFLEELCRASSVERLDHAPSPVEYAPQWLYSLVQARCLQLDPLARQVVDVAAVFGASPPLWLLQKVAGFDGNSPMAELSELDLLFPGQQGEWHFKHGLTREIVYDLIGLQDKRRLHRTIAQALIDSEDGESTYLEALAFHFARAGMRNEAVHFAELAGDRALAAPAIALARSQFRLAIEMLETEYVSTGNYRHIMSLARRLNTAAVLDPSDDELPLLKRILSLAEQRRDLKGQANANYWLGTLMYGLGLPRKALRYYFRARTLAQECGHERLVTETDRTLGQATASSCDHLSAIALLRKVSRGYSAVEPGSGASMAMAYSIGCLGMVLGDQGDFAGADEQFRLARRLLAQRENNPTEINIAAKVSGVELWREDWDAAIATAERVSEMAERITNYYLFGMGRMVSAYARWRRDGDADQVQVMKETTAWLEKSGQGQFLSLNYGWLAESCAALEQYDDVRKYVARAICRNRKGDGFGLAIAARAAARVSVAACWRHPPHYYLTMARRSAEQRNSLREMALNDECGALLAAAAGDTQTATRLTEAASTKFERLGMRCGDVTSEDRAG